MFIFSLDFRVMFFASMLMSPSDFRVMAVFPFNSIKLLSSFFNRILSLSPLSSNANFFSSSSSNKYPAILLPSIENEDCFL